MRILDDVKLDYQDVLLRPKRSTIKSRSIIKMRMVHAQRLSFRIHSFNKSSISIYMIYRAPQYYNPSIHNISFDQQD